MGYNSGSDAIRLLGVNAWGGYAEYVKARCTKTSIMPDGIDSRPPP